MAKTADKPKALFEMREEGNKINVVHVGTGTVLRSFKADNGTVAAECADFCDTASRKGVAALKRQTAKASDDQKSLLGKVLDLTYPDHDKPVVREILSKAKTRDSYTSGARQAFQPNNITAKEKLILEAVEKQTDPTATSVAESIGMTANQVNGALSVLLAKAIVSTERKRVGSDIRRVISITRRDWAKIEPPKKEPKAKPTAAPAATNGKATAKAAAKTKTTAAAK